MVNPDRKWDDVGQQDQTAPLEDVPDIREHPPDGPGQVGMPPEQQEDQTVPPEDVPDIREHPPDGPGQVGMPPEQQEDQTVSLEDVPDIREHPPDGPVPVLVGGKGSCPPGEKGEIDQAAEVGGYPGGNPSGQLPRPRTDELDPAHDYTQDETDDPDP